MLVLTTCTLLVSAPILSVGGVRLPAAIGAVERDGVRVPDCRRSVGRFLHSRLIAEIIPNSTGGSGEFGRDRAQ